MNIKRAKIEIKNAIEAYLQKDDFGEYTIPAIRQRPILLMGPPGIGKTQIMEQIARECEISLVAYTITHHTRQSAVGLPFIEKKCYGGREYSVTEYTMSEIIASVYEKIEETGVKEGILFIDEINCVSETLAPAMLQFLQCKTFGNQKVPEGWIIVAAGNPPEYNKSVRDFDIVTLDRIKKIEVEENYDVWKEYAYRAQIHPAIRSYLELKKENFYKMETSVDGREFATARGWEDLSKLLKAYEVLGKKADREVVHQYIQHWRIAKDFAVYLELFEKYKKDYGLEHILEGHFDRTAMEQIKTASFDERLSVVGMLMGKLSSLFKECYRADKYVTMLYEALKRYKESGQLDLVCREVSEEYERLRKAERLSKEEDHIWKKVVSKLSEYQFMTVRDHLGKEEGFAAVKEAFEQEVDGRQQLFDRTGSALDHTFDFLEETGLTGQEMVAFIAELNTDYYSIQYLKENDCDKYYMYNKRLLFDEQQEKILGQLEDVEKQLSGIELLKE